MNSNMRRTTSIVHINNSALSAIGQLAGMHIACLSRRAFPLLAIGGLFALSYQSAKADGTLPVSPALPAPFAPVLPPLPDQSTQTTSSQSGGAPLGSQMKVSGGGSSSAPEQAAFSGNGSATGFAVPSLFGARSAAPAPVVLTIVGYPGRTSAGYNPNLTVRVTNTTPVAFNNLAIVGKFSTLSQPSYGLSCLGPFFNVPANSSTDVTLSIPTQKFVSFKPLKYIQLSGYTAVGEVDLSIPYTNIQATLSNVRFVIPPPTPGL